MAMIYTYRIRPEKVEPSKSRGVARYREGGHRRKGKVEKVEAEDDPKSMLGEKNRDEAFRKLAAQQQHPKQSPISSSQTKSNRPAAPRQPPRKMPTG